MEFFLTLIFWLIMCVSLSSSNSCSSVPEPHTVSSRALCGVGGVCVGVCVGVVGCSSQIRALVFQLTIKRLLQVLFFVASVRDWL